jgi:hypothetical protein
MQEDHDAKTNPMTTPPIRAGRRICVATVHASVGCRARRTARSRTGRGTAVIIGPAASAVFRLSVVTAAVVRIPRGNGGVVARARTRRGAHGRQGASGRGPDGLAETGPGGEGGAGAAIAGLLRRGQGAAGLRTGRQIAIALGQQLGGGGGGEQEDAAELHRGCGSSGTRGGSCLDLRLEVWE